MSISYSLKYLNEKTTKNFYANRNAFRSFCHHKLYMELELEVFFLEIIFKLIRVKKISMTSVTFFISFYMYESKKKEEKLTHYRRSILE